MQTWASEKLGFICRWVLLGMSAVVVATVVWTAAAATFSARQDLQTGVILVDSMWSPNTRSPYIAALPAPAIPSDEAPLVYVVDHLHRTQLGNTNRSQQHITAYLTETPVGTPHRILMRGIPYGPLAFNETTARVFVVADATEVYFVDARMIAENLDKRKGTIDRMLQELTRLGQPALICPVPPVDFLPLKRKLQDYGKYPLLCSTHKGQSDLMTTIWRNRHLLKRTTRTRVPPVITNDPELARRAAQQMHFVHLVHPSPDNVVGGTSGRIYKSLEALVEHLSKEHLTFQPIAD